MGRYRDRILWGITRAFMRDSRLALILKPRSSHVLQHRCSAWQATSMALHDTTRLFVILLILVLKLARRIDLKGILKILNKMFSVIIP